MYSQGRADKSPAKDIITMMREFQAENEKHRTTAENQSTGLLNADSNEMILPATTNDQSAPSTPTKQRHLDQQTKPTNPVKTNLQERRGMIDRNKTSTKTTKFPSDTLKVSWRFANNRRKSLFCFRHPDVRIMPRMSQMSIHRIIIHEQVN